MRTYSADLIIPADRPPIIKGFVSVDDSGMITDVGYVLPAGQEAIHLDGILVPGFVNTHCHLELSHLKNRVDTGTGLLPFLRGVVTLRDIDPADIDRAIVEADKEMWREGIQAVGDISNTADTAPTKSKSKITYVTFVEVFDFLQGGEMAEQVFAKAQLAYDVQPDPKRYVPHAPYTVSPRLHELINAANLKGGTVSIHNQETPDEDDLFLTKTGGFIDFYADFGFSLDHFQPSGKTSLGATLPHMSAKHRTLLVHNTQTTMADIEAAEEWSGSVYWATCPNANLYIENRLPNYAMFMESGVRVTIGTDSLTSNWQLSILEEIKTIQRYQSFVDTRTLVQWATINGAEALGLDAQLGSITKGKRPGLIQITGITEEGRFTPESKANRVV